MAKNLEKQTKECIELHAPLKGTKEMHHTVPIFSLYSTKEIS